MGQGREALAVMGPEETAWNCGKEGQGMLGKGLHQRAVGMEKA